MTTASPTPATDDVAAELDAAAHRQAALRNFRWQSIAWIAVLHCTTGIAEATSNYIMPDTIHRFTQNAFFISVILSLNPLFGFVAQPLAGWYSDRIWTPIGRRLPLILGGAVCLAASCLGLPFAQAQAEKLGWAAGAVRWLGREELSLGLVVMSFWILVYQFMVDVVAIMVRCLIGDTVPTRYRGKAFAAAQMVSTVMIFSTLWWGGAVARAGEWKWYAIVAGVALLVTIPATVWLKEPYVPPPRPKRRHGGGYWRTIFATPHFFTMCLVIACTFVAGQLITNYYRLFTKEQLNLDLAAALRPFSWMPVIAFFVSFPIGWLCDRVSQKRMAQVGSLLLALTGLWAAFATSLWDLRILAVLLGLGLVCIDVSVSAYLINFIPAGKLGQLSGFANIFRGGPRFLMFFGAGALIEQFGRNYRIAFVGAVVFGILAFVMLCFLPREKANGEDGASAKPPPP